MRGAHRRRRTPVVGRRRRPSAGPDSALGELLVAEEALLETVALTPTVGLVGDPYGGPGDGPVVSGPEPGATESLVRGIVQAGPLAVGGVLANLINVVATVLIARLLTSRQYGSVAQLLGLFFVLSMPGSALLVAVVRRIAAEATTGRRAVARRWSVLVYRRAVVGVAIFSVVAVAVCVPLAHALRIRSGAAVALTLIAGGIWLVLCVDRGVLQVQRRYAGLGFNLFFEIAVRTALVLVLAAAGLGVPGYAVGLALGELAAAVQAHLVARRSWEQAAPEGGALPGTTARSVSSDLLTALIGFGLIGILQNSDIILVGRLDPGSSGAYAAISVTAKSLVFGAILLGSYMLPEAALRWHRGQHALRPLAVTLVFLAVPTVVLLGVSLAVPYTFLKVVFGHRLAASAPGFAQLVGAMACLGLTVVLTNYLFGAARRWVVVLLGAGVVALLVRIHQANGAIVGTARAELEVQAALAAAVSLAFVATHWRFWRRRSAAAAEPAPERRLSAATP